MAAQLLGDLFLNGIAAASSGTARFYQPNTLVPVTVYSDDAATQAITQPVPLDGSGKSIVPVYLTGPARMIVYTSNGAQYLDVTRVDGVRAESTALSNALWPSVSSLDAMATALATSLGGTSGNFKASGTGAVNRSVQSKNSEQVSVKDFGAVGNGVADDTGAFVSAIAYAKALGGAVIFLPAGNYLISSALTLNNDGVSLKGTGSLTSVITQSSSTANGIIVAGNRLFLEDIGIVASTTSTGIGVTPSGTLSFITLSRVRIVNFGYCVWDNSQVTTRLNIRDCELIADPAQALACIRLAVAAAPTITNNYMSTAASGVSADAILLSNSTANATIVGNYIAQAASGIVLQGVSGVAMVGNTFASAVTTAWSMDATTTFVTDVGNTVINLSTSYSDNSTAGSNTYASPLSGRWSAGYTGTSTSIAVTSTFTPNNQKFNYQRCVGTAGGITITVANPTITPQRSGPSLLLFLENQSGGAVTWSFGSQYRTSAAVNPGTGTGIALTFVWDQAVTKWVEMNRSAAV